MAVEARDRPGLVDPLVGEESQLEGLRNSSAPAAPAPVVGVRGFCS